MVQQRPHEKPEQFLPQLQKSQVSLGVPLPWGRPPVCCPRPAQAEWGALEKKPVMHKYQSGVLSHLALSKSCQILTGYSQAAVFPE